MEGRKSMAVIKGQKEFEKFKARKGSPGKRQCWLNATFVMVVQKVASTAGAPVSHPTNSCHTGKITQAKGRRLALKTAFLWVLKG